MCMEIKHFVSGSPIRLENCVKGRGEVGWSHGQVRLISLQLRCRSHSSVSEKAVTRKQGESDGDVNVTLFHQFHFKNGT